MSNLRHNSPSERRSTCQAYVDDSAKFVGQQQGWGIVLAAVAATSVTAGAAVTNSDDGNAWSKNKKTILLTAAVPTAVLAYNFLSNASSGTTSSASASLALAEKDDDAMWAGCEKARAAYWDGRTAGIAAASSNLGKSQGTPTTPQGREDAGSLAAAEAAAEKAANAAAAANEAVEEATKKKDPNTDPTVTVTQKGHFNNAAAAKDEAKLAEDKAKEAVTALKAAIAAGDTNMVRAKRTEAENAGDDANRKLETVRSELTLY